MKNKDGKYTIKISGPGLVSEIVLANDASIELAEKIISIIKTKIKNEKVTIIEEDGNRKQIPIDDAILEYLEHWDWEECYDLMLEYLTLGDVQRLIVESMTIEQKKNFLEEVSE